MHNKIGFDYVSEENVIYRSGVFKDFEVTFDTKLWFMNYLEIGNRCYNS